MIDITTDTRCIHQAYALSSSAHLLREGAPSTKSHGTLLIVCAGADNIGTDLLVGETTRRREKHVDESGVHGGGLPIGVLALCSGGSGVEGCDGWLCGAAFVVDIVEHVQHKLPRCPVTSHASGRI